MNQNDSNFYRIVLTCVGLHLAATLCVAQPIRLGGRGFAPDDRRHASFIVQLAGGLDGSSRFNDNGESRRELCQAFAGTVKSTPIVAATLTEQGLKPDTWQDYASIETSLSGSNEITIDIGIDKSMDVGDDRLSKLAVSLTERAGQLLTRSLQDRKITDDEHLKKVSDELAQLKAEQSQLEAEDPNNPNPQADHLRTLRLRQRDMSDRIAISNARLKALQALANTQSFDQMVGPLSSQAVAAADRLIDLRSKRLDELEQRQAAGPGNLDQIADAQAALDDARAVAAASSANFEAVKMLLATAARAPSEAIVATTTDIAGFTAQLQSIESELPKTPAPATGEMVANYGLMLQRKNDVLRRLPELQNEFETARDQVARLEHPPHFVVLGGAATQPAAQQ